MRSIVLIGYRGVGKTSLGLKVAEALGVPFVDSDDAILAVAGKDSVQSIWDEGGEDAWRALEVEVIPKLLENGGVIALGGGAPCIPSIRLLLEERDDVVYLSAGIDVLRERLEASTQRPSLAKEDATMLSERHPIYLACASTTIDASDSKDQAFDLLMKAIK